MLEFDSSGSKVVVRVSEKQGNKATGVWKIQKRSATH